MIAITICPTCGCPVAEQGAHNQFHQRIDSLVRQFLASTENAS